MTVVFNNNFITGWPTDPAFVRKYSGTCIHDYSSTGGAICMLETNDTDMS